MVAFRRERIVAQCRTLRFSAPEVLHKPCLACEGPVGKELENVKA